MPRQPALSSSRSERGQNFEAFSGTGFALGSGASGRNPRKTSKPTATVTSEIQIAQLDNRARTEITRAVSPIDRLDDRNLHQIGPSGDNYIQNYNVNRATGGLDNNVSGSVVIPRNRHVSRSGDGTDNVGNRLVGLGDSDMVGSLGYSGIENEDQIFQEVSTIMTLCFWTDRSRQTVPDQTAPRGAPISLGSSLIRVFAVCYSISIILTKYPKVWPLCLNFR